MGEAVPGAAEDTSGDRLPAQPLRRFTAGERFSGLLRLLHPVPASLYVVAVGAFALVAAATSHRPIDGSAFVRVLLAVACAQAAIAALNDYRDRALDARTKPHKPLVEGSVSPATALALVIGASVVLVVLGATLGPGALVLIALIEGLGVAYDLWFKGTWVSGLLYAMYFPLIPLLAWVVFGRYQPFVPWVLPIGAILGVTMNVANSLPDLEDDIAQGVRGLPHLLGLRRGLLVAWVAPVGVAALLWALALTGVVPARPAGLLIATLAAVVPSLVAWLRYRASPTAQTLRGNFLLGAVGVVGMGIGWIAAVAG